MVQQNIQDAIGDMHKVQDSETQPLFSCMYCTTTYLEVQLDCGSFLECYYPVDCIVFGHTRHFPFLCIFLKKIKNWAFTNTLKLGFK